MKRYRLMMAVGAVGLVLGALLAWAARADGGLTADGVYKKKCAKCHGKSATGRHFGGPSLISDKAASATAEELRKMIADGKGRMPKFAGKLTAEEIDTLVQEIQSLNKK